MADIGMPLLICFNCNRRLIPTIATIEEDLFPLIDKYTNGMPIPVRQIFIIFLTVPLILYWIKKFWALWREKLLNLRKAFQNQGVQILCSYWMTDFSELRRELLKAGQSQLGSFEIHQIFFRLKILFWKAVNSAPATFESRPGPILPVFKSFLQSQKVFM
jgi:hypothetical protein